MRALIQRMGLASVLVAFSLAALASAAGPATIDLPAPRNVRASIQSAGTLRSISNLPLQRVAVAIPAAPTPADRIDPAFSAASFEVWLSDVPERRATFHQFESYLREAGVGGVAPSFQLWRTGTLFRQCGAEAFVVPERKYWPHIVGALRFIRDRIKPAIGAVEVVSAYRTEAFNACAGGAPHSAHRLYSALDLVPLQPIARPRLVEVVCRVQWRYGKPAHIGLGFYEGVRFHIDSNGFRHWGPDGAGETSPCRALTNKS